MNKPVLPNSVEARDIAFHLHSQTNPRLLEERGPLVVARGEGSCLGSGGNLKAA